jgi:hypothetical protein
MVKIGSPVAPSATLDVARNTASTTAAFRGTNYDCFFNTGSTEDSYINGGKNNSNVIISNINGGKTGIGVYPSITDGVLDVNGRMQIRSGGDNIHSAGIWLNKNDNSAKEAFLGMIDGVHVGFANTNGSLSFSMNTQTGSLKINGDEGSGGQVLTSNGSGLAPTWQSLPPAGAGSLFEKSFSFTQSAPLNLNCNNCVGDMIPTGVAVISITVPSKVLISYSGLVEPLSTGLLSSDTRAMISLAILNSSGLVFADDYKMMAFRDGGSSFSKTTRLVSLSPGNYTLKMSAQQGSGSGNPGTDFTHGVITAIILEQ